MLDILCATDLSPTAAAGVLFADDLASRMAGNVTLLHVLGKNERTGEGRDKAQVFMDRHASLVEHTTVTELMLEGDALATIAEEASRHAMMVCATHGPQGLRQQLFGADILKLVRKLPVPCLVVQDQSTVPARPGPVVLPVAGHENITGLLDAVVMLARAYQAPVHIFQLLRPGESPSDQLLENKKRMMLHLEEHGVSHEEIDVPGTTFSIGFAAGTIAHARKAEASCIAIMADASDEYRYMADAENGCSPMSTASRSSAHLDPSTPKWVLPALQGPASLQVMGTRTQLRPKAASSNTRELTWWAAMLVLAAATLVLGLVA